MRRISFAATIEQFRARTKTVTRRIGWENVRVGERLRAVDRVMGFRDGARATALGVIEVVAASRIQLEQIDQQDVVAEGFATLTPSEFIEFFCAKFRVDRRAIVTRIEFKYVDEPVVP